MAILLAPFGGILLAASFWLDGIRRAREVGNDEPSILLRQADAAYLLGNVDAERRLRDSIYGSIAEP